MKKRFSKWKEKSGSVILILAALSLLCGMAMPVYGTEKRESTGDSDANGVNAQRNQAPKKVVTDIYHRHIGKPDTLGGCYTLAIEHKHQGSAGTGGGCYTKPVYHTHQGSEDTGGGCYGKEVYHEHQGNAADGGGCYSEPVCHKHQDSCYEERSCMISYTPGNVVGTETGRCFAGHGETTFVRVEGKAEHDSCDEGKKDSTFSYCQQCGFMAPIMHRYQAVICGKDDKTVEGYEKGCGKEDTDVERYELNCGRREDEIDSYEIECDRDVDGYELACGLGEDAPCGHLIITNETKGTAEQVTLRVELKDLTGGKLALDSNPYIWQDAHGNQMGSGDEIQVKENGDYSVRVRLKNKDVDESGLTGQIPVDNILKETVKPTASASPTPSQSPAASENPTSHPTPADKPDDGSDDKPGDKSDNEPDDKSDAGTSENEEILPEQNRETIQPTPKKEGSPRKADEDTSAGSKQIREPVRSGGKKAEEKAQEDKPDPSTTPSPTIRKETKKAALPKKQAIEEIRYKIGQTEKRNGIFANPMVRMITVTAGVLVLIAGMLLWLFYLRNSVKVYNDDGEGRMIYLGRCLVGPEEDVYTIKITEKMVEKAYTNRYCIKPGLFRVGREEEALVVRKDPKNATVYIAKEMIVVL